MVYQICTLKLYMYTLAGFMYHVNALLYNTVTTFTLTFEMWQQSYRKAHVCVIYNIATFLITCWKLTHVYTYVSTYVNGYNALILSAHLIDFIILHHYCM